LVEKCQPTTSPSVLPHHAPARGAAAHIWPAQGNWRKPSSAVLLGSARVSLPEAAGHGTAQCGIWRQLPP